MNKEKEKLLRQGRIIGWVSLAILLFGLAAGYAPGPTRYPPIWEGWFSKQESSIHTYTVSGANVREKVHCEFDEPLKHLTLIMHWYDTSEEMYADYITLADPVEHEEIWGWSNCAWQPDDNWAACDVYVVKPDFVHADMNIDTIGHEILHGACGDYHE